MFAIDTHCIDIDSERMHNYWVANGHFRFRHTSGGTGQSSYSAILSDLEVMESSVMCQNFERHNIEGVSNNESNHCFCRVLLEAFG